MAVDRSGLELLTSKKFLGSLLLLPIGLHYVFSRVTHLFIQQILNKHLLHARYYIHVAVHITVRLCATAAG